MSEELNKKKLNFNDFLTLLEIKKPYNETQFLIFFVKLK